MGNQPSRRTDCARSFPRTIMTTRGPVSALDRGVGSASRASGHWQFDGWDARLAGKYPDFTDAVVPMASQPMEAGPAGLPRVSTEARQVEEQRADRRSRQHLRPPQPQRSEGRHTRLHLARRLFDDGRTLGTMQFVAQVRPVWLALWVLFLLT